MAYSTVKNTALPLLLFGISMLGSWAWPILDGNHNPLPVAENTGRGALNLPIAPAPKVQGAAQKGKELISQLCAAFSDDEKPDLDKCISLLLVLDEQLKESPDKTWLEVMSAGPKAKALQRYAANRIGLFHGAALMGTGNIPVVYQDLPPSAFLAGCARRADFAGEIKSVMTWNPRRGNGRFPGSAGALKELAREWAKFNRNGDLPWPSGEFSSELHKLALNGVEAGLAEIGHGGRMISAQILSDWASKGAAQVELAYDGAAENWPAPSRSALQLLGIAGDPIKALELAKKSGASYLTVEIVGLSIAMKTVPLEGILKWAQSSPDSMMQIAAIVGSSAPAEGLKWLEQLDPKSPQTRAAAGKLLNAWAMTKPEEAVQACLSSNLFAGLSSDFYAWPLQNLGAKNPAEAVRLLETMDLGTTTPAAFRDALVQEVSRNQPEYFQKQVMAGVETGLGANDLAMWVSHLSMKQGTSGAEWALANAPRMASEEVAGAVIRGLASKDPVSASNFANTLESGPARDGAASALVALTVESEPASAFEWAVSISDPARRQSALIQSLTGLERAGVSINSYLTRAGISQWPLPPSQP